MKKRTLKSLSVFLVMCLLLTAAPLFGLQSILSAPAAEAATYKEGDIIKFGGYPQTRVTDRATIKKLNAVNKTWKSYRYYTGTGQWDNGEMVPADYMRWADFTLDGVKYRAVTFDTFRPAETGVATGVNLRAGYAHQEDNGYETQEFYYFKYEPLEWRVLDTIDCLVISEKIIDAQAFQNFVCRGWPEYYQDTEQTNFANNYEKSSIRQWLITDFYNTAFSSKEKALIGTTRLVNKGYDERFTSSVTNDKIFFLTYQDAVNGDLGFGSADGSYDAASRRAYGTDYAKCQGLGVSGLYEGSSWWWLRTAGIKSQSAVCIDDSGNCDANEEVAFTGVGVRPCFEFASEITQSVNPNGGQAAKTYAVNYNANGGSGAPSAQQKTENAALTLSLTKPAKSYTITYNSTGGTTPIEKKTVACTFKNWNTKADGSGTSYAPGASYTANAAVTLYAQYANPKAGELSYSKMAGYEFVGWFTAASGGTQVTANTTLTKSMTVYAHWKKVVQQTYTVSYNANGGTGTPSAQTKTGGTALKLSTAVPTKKYTLAYNAAGGSVSPASKALSCTFKNWNTKSDGTGTSYAAGANYTADASVTLYAQWTNPTAGTLATPTRSGYSFTGWYTAPSGGTKVTSSTTVSGNTTVYAHWSNGTTTENIYNMGEETYSFENYGDSDSAFGHCFGMSSTSSGYYMGILDIKTVGGSASKPLYSLTASQTVKTPICYYQQIQGATSRAAIVAGGSTYLTGTPNIASDWTAVVNYVKNHAYDNKGSLQIGIRKESQGGHAINFLRYENVNGQDRIYAYDNNFPKQETYFYKDSAGKVYQAPLQTFSGNLDCIALRDMKTYFAQAKNFNAMHAVYVAKDAAKIQGLTYSFMEGVVNGPEYVMYEVPENQSSVVIVPNVDNADFIYMGREYSFGKITDETFGKLKLQSLDEHGVATEASFEIFEGSSVQATPGDVNKDGAIGADDARLALRRSVDLENYAYGSAEFLACDVNGDKSVGADDARLILRASVDLEDPTKWKK